jgi:GTP diphosphokinase / guanosine-3',5'-bis(diphosphate) 3'-diphosphatase
MTTAKVTAAEGDYKAVIKDLEADFQQVISTLQEFHPKSDVDVVRLSFEKAAYYHRYQTRRSGEPYITHPLAVALILAELGMTATTLAAAFLHDTVEDTEYSLEDLTTDFGPEIAALVDGVTKLDKVKYGEASVAETVRKMVIAMARDIRVLVIKLCDRLHNMRTMDAMPSDKQLKISRETLEIYAPLAHRLGMNTIKFELEDVSFKYLYAKRYEEIVRLVNQKAPERQLQLDSIVSSVEADLNEAKISATISGRPKHYYSVYQKMIVRGRDLDDIYDLVGVRILVDTVGDCYTVLGRIHSRWNPVPGRFKDYIAMPKFTMYQSLHTTVIGPHGRPVEFQIRTHEMHRSAEYGVAAHWRYKQNAENKQGDDFSWLRQLLDWQREADDPDEFLDSLRYDLSSKEVYVFTPKGDVIGLPVGSTPVDFAYSVHTEVGHHCVGARVNGKLVPLESTLNNGDVIEIFTSRADSAAPSRDWLNFVVSGRARAKIRAWYSKERREDAEEQGKDAILRSMRKQGLPLQRLMTNANMSALALDLRYPDLSALYAAVGESKISASAVIQKLLASQGGDEGTLEDLSEAVIPTQTRHRKGLPQGDPGVLVKGAADVWVKLAKCCTPVPGDEICGYVTRGSGVSVHRKDCINVKSLENEPERLLEVEWSNRINSVFLVNIQIEALDRSRLLSDVTKMLSDQHVNILSAAVTTTRDRVALSKFTFEMSDPRQLNSLINSVRSIDGVYDCYRV